MKLASLLGKYTARTCKVLKRQETKVTWLIATWTVETYIFFLALYVTLFTGSPVLALSLFFFYIYGSYSLFSVINN